MPSLFARSSLSLSFSISYAVIHPLYTHPPTLSPTARTCRDTTADGVVGRSGRENSTGAKGHGAKGPLHLAGTGKSEVATAASAHCLSTTRSRSCLCPRHHPKSHRGGSCGQVTHPMDVSRHCIIPPPYIICGSLVVTLNTYLLQEKGSR